MLNNEQLREYIIKPVLGALSIYSKQAEDLLVLTCAQESAGGTYIHQVGGPALGIYQMEPATHDDIWIFYLKLQPVLCYHFMAYFQMIHPIPNASRMVGDLMYATGMARIHYLRTNAPIPTDIVEISEYYKQYYNTPKGAATASEALLNYRKFIGEPCNEKVKNSKTK